MSEGQKLGIDLSVVVPVFNEEDVIELTLAQLRSVLDDAGVTYEVLMVDDGSKDSTVARAKQFALHEGWADLEILQLQRNFGHMAALSAGIDNANGEWVAMMDGDLQHPPAILMEMFTKARATGAPLVQGVRSEQSGASSSKRLLSRAFYWFTKKTSGIEITPGASDFRIMSRAVVDDLKRLPEEDKVYRLLLPWLGYETILVPYAAPARAGGSPSYSTKKSAALGVSGVIGFTTAPLRFVTVSGLIVGVFALVWLIYVVAVFFSGGALQGWTSILAAVLIIGSVQLIGIGLLGEYLARAYRRLQGRPTYVLKK